MSSRNVLKTGSNEMELVDFRVLRGTDSEKDYEGIFGVNVAKVREIIKIPVLTELPGTPEYVDGIFDLRGVVIPVINLAKWMGFREPKSQPSKRIIITEFSDVLIGFVVHEAKRIRRINWADIEPASFSTGAGVLDKSKITGVTRIEDDLVLLILDFESIVGDLGLYEIGSSMHSDDIAQIGGTALILDDSAMARKIVKDSVEQLGMQVIEAHDGQDGLEKLNNLQAIYGEKLRDELKIIVTDVEMPRMDGFHFTSNVRSNEKYEDIPIIFNSSISDHFSDIRGEEVGADGYITKFKTDTFHDIIMKAITKREAERRM
jgi:two-component system chemotaxis response regulator CheV